MEKVEEYLTKYTDCYEVLNPEFNRVYLDIDYHTDPTWSDEVFAEKDTSVYDKVIELFGERVAIAKSSSYIHHKISWRVFFIDEFADKKTNKLFAKKIQNEFPNEVKVDPNVYGTNQKIRMLNSSKDGENRPLKLVKGNIKDTIISYVPDSCVRMPFEDPKETIAREREEKKKQKEEEKKQKDDDKKRTLNEKETLKRNAELMTYVEYLTLKRLADYDSWIKLGMILWSSGIPLATWDEISQRANNYESGACEEKWATFRTSETTIGMPTILAWIEEDTPEIFNKMYPQMKAKFEENHFKVMNPAQYVRLHTREDKTKTIQLCAEIGTQYANVFTLNNELFVGKWMKDETIRCYETIGFYPNPSKTPADEFNLYNGFSVVDIEPSTPAPDISRILHQIRCLVAHNEEHFNYLIRWIAHLFQFPEIKALVYLTFNGPNGTGKDSFWEFVGALMGDELYLPNARLEDDICGRFNFISSRRILIQVQEVSREAAKKYKDTIKRIVTQTKGIYEDKGVKQVKLNSYERYVFTTNDDVPMFIEQGERRPCIFTPSAVHCGDTKYWNTLFADYENPAVQRAFYDYLMKIDLTGWDIKNRPITDTYRDAAIVSAPPLARFFGDCLAEHMTGRHSWSPTELCDVLNERLRYTVTRIGVGKEIKPYITAGCVRTSGGHHGPVRYILENEKVKEYLKNKGWWYEDPRQAGGEEEEEDSSCL